MAKFNFKAKNALNEVVEGARNAVSEKELISALRNEGLAVYSVEEAAAEAGVKARIKQIRSGGHGGVNAQDIAVFCRQMATLINAGVNILDAIDDISEMATSSRLRAVLKTVGSNVREGSTLSDAMKRHDKVFGRVFVSMIEAGEKSGKLGKVLQDLASYTENSVKLQRKMKAASVYPAFIVCFLIATMMVLVLFIIPRFESMFASFGAELPLPTKIVMGFSRAVINNIMLIILAVAGAVTGVVMSYKTPAGRMIIDRFVLSIPIFGPIVKKVVFARFFQTFGTLLRSGVDIVASLEIAARVTNSLPVQRVIETIRTKVIEGSSLSAEMEKHGIFPRMVVRMTAVGEKSGQIDEMCEKMSDYYSDEVDTAVAAMSSIIEPLLIVLLGIVVGVAVVAMYLPIFKLAGAMMGK